MKLQFMILASLAAVGASACRVRTITPEADATFAMHQESRDFVIDRAASVASADVVPAKWLRGPGQPMWALRRDGRTLAAYWIDGDAGTTARAGPTRSDDALGAVRPSWDDNAIRLAIEPRDGDPVRSDLFGRTVGGGPDALRRSAQTILDVRGRYRAALRDASGAEVGWIGLRIGPYEQAARIYEAALPTAIDERLAIAAVLALATEIDWIESHALNVYQGDQAGPLIESYPLHH